MSRQLAALGEHQLIQRLRERVGRAPAHVEIGIGDDAAVIAPDRGMVEVVTTDALVEGVHFRRDWTAPSAIGHKALAVNLSDLASMGATPRASLLSLALPDDLPVDDFDELVDGFVTLASSAKAPLVGGNMTRSPGPIFISVTAIGSVRRRRVLRRDTAHAGDELYVTGTIGGAAAGLAMLAAGIERASLDDAARECLKRYERPDARLRCGFNVGRIGAATAAMDVSDGLAAAARAIAEASGVGVVVDADALPIHPGVPGWCLQSHADPISVALAGGEDYELAFAVSPRLRSRFLAAVRRSHGLAATKVGRFTRERTAVMVRNGRIESLPEGFVHFSASSESVESK